MVPVSADQSSSSSEFANDVEEVPLSPSASLSDPHVPGTTKHFKIPGQIPLSHFVPVPQFRMASNCDVPHHKFCVSPT